MIDGLEHDRQYKLCTPRQKNPPSLSSVSFLLRPGHLIQPLRPGMPPENIVQRGGGQRAPARPIAPGRGGATASSVPHQNVDRLNAAVAAIEKLKEELSDVRKNADERVAILYRKTVLLEAELAASCKRIRYLEKLAGYPESEDEAERGDANGTRESAQEAATSGEQQASEGDGGGNGAASLQTVESVARSQYWMDKKEIKDIVAIALKKLMNIRDQRLLRLDWGSNHDSPINSAALEAVRKWIRANGKVELTGSAVALQEILDGDLGARITKKFTYMRDQYRRRARLLGIATPGPGTCTPSVALRREGGGFEGSGDGNGEGEGGGDGEGGELGDGEGNEHGEGGGHGGVDGAADVRAARAKYNELTGGRNVSAMFIQ
ncbi:hypothetical protein BC628DRAFT_223895 [Trametes gibbosa]|nr:hypothetical protein BC628DRAFT_223895 [Trametes gibbosa]